jgi:hypothetical protein
VGGAGRYQAHVDIIESLCKPPDEILNLIYLYIHWPIHKDLSHLGHLPPGPILGGLGSGSWANGYQEKWHSKIHQVAFRNSLI